MPAARAVTVVVAVACAAGLLAVVAPARAARARDGDDESAPCPALDERIAAWVERLATAPPGERPRARAAIVRLGRGAVPLLLAALAHTVDDGVRGEIARTLGELRDPAAHDALVAIARGETGRTEVGETRRAALLALGHLAAAAGAPEIRRHLASRDPETRDAAREAAVLLDGWAAIPTLIDVLRADDRRVQLRARERLQEITGETLPLDADAWQRYWDDHRDIGPR